MLFIEFVRLWWVCRLIGNPVCNQGGDNLSYCKIVQSTSSYSTPQNCETVPPTCSSDQMLSPNCNCAYPYRGTLYFIAPSFSDLGNTTYYLILEQELKKSFVNNKLPVDSVSLDNPFVDSNSNLVISLQVFPSGKIRFSERDITNIGHMFSNIVFRPPKIFVTYYFIGQPYTALDGKLVLSWNPQSSIFERLLWEIWSLVLLLFIQFLHQCQNQDTFWSLLERQLAPRLL